LKNKLYIVLLIWLFMPTGCRLIDDDLSVCGTESDYLVNYQVRLTTQINMTIDEKLSSEIEKPIAQALKKWSEPIFSGHAHDLDMSFYSLDGTDELKYHQFEIIDAMRKSYTLTIPRQDYMHLAVVNILDNNDVTMMGGQQAATMYLGQRTADTLLSHTTGVYTARLPMHMTEGVNLSFDVHLYMVSCAVALVIQDSTSTANPVIERLILTGTASGFSVQDSVYSFYSPSAIRAEKVRDDCYAAVAFPSRDAAPVAIAGKNMTASGSLWQLSAFVRLEDGTVTQTQLTFDKPLKAGTMEIIKVYMKNDGSLDTKDAEVGVTVTLDWKSGTTQELITG